MSYRINRTDGELLVDLTDGVIDNSVTDLTLIGKNYKGFGEWLNENFVRLLENFASTSQPANPLTGQLWYDKQDQRLKIFNGTFFRSATGTIVNSTEPTNLVAGDIWIDNANNRLYLFDGADLTLVGPTYDAGQGRTGFEADTQLDDKNVAHTILKMFVGGKLTGIFATEEFWIPYDFVISTLDPDPEDTFNPPRQRLKRGFNIVNRTAESGTDGFWWRGVAQASKALLDDNGNMKESKHFLPTDGDAVTTGYISIKNSQGLTIGVGDRPYVQTKIFGNTTYVDNLEVDANYSLRIKNAQFKNSQIEALRIDSSEYKVTMFADLPITYQPLTNKYDFSLISSRPKLEFWGDMFTAGDQYFAGNVSVQGDLDVAGETVYVNTENLYIQDKNIELAINSDGDMGTDSIVDDGGIILKSSDGDKVIQWHVTTKAWDINQNINITDGPSITDPSYKINGMPILSATTLAPEVTSAVGLTSIGTLVDLTVDNVRIDGQSIEVIGSSGLTIDAKGELSVANQRVTDVGDPINDYDATNLKYVEETIAGQGVLLTFDINGLLIGSDPQTAPFNAGTIENVRLIAEQLRSAATVLPGTVLKVLATSIKEISATVPVTIGFDDDATLQVAKVTVRNFDNTGTVAVLEDIAANPSSSGVSADISFDVDRFIYRFDSDGFNWINPLVERIVL
jgi:hypothetical protein